MMLSTKKKETKIKCDKMLWEHLAFLVKDEIADYKAKDAAIEAEIKAIEKEKGTLRQNYLDKEAEIKKESGNTVNTDEAFESMNAMLKDSGFRASLFVRNRVSRTVMRWFVMAISRSSV